MNRIPFSREKCLDTWQNRSNSGDEIGNRPCDYAGKDRRVVQFLVDRVGPLIAQDSRILEVGCNAGANLDGFFRAGFTNLYGIEINRNAIREMENSFPALYRTAFTLAGDAVEVSKFLPDTYFDIVYSMAALMHIHPSGADSLFKNMARISRRYICTMENESARTVYIFPRNYREIFEDLGMKQISEQEMDPALVGESYRNYMVRIFERPPPQ